MIDVKNLSKAQMIEAIKNNQISWSYISDIFKVWGNNKQVVKTVLKRDAQMLCHASEDIKNDLEFLMILKKKGEKVLRKSWYEQRMRIMEILEDDILMRKDVKLSQKRVNLKKF